MNDRRLVLDTNALISRLLVPTGVAAKALDHALASGVLLLSEETLGELAEVLARPKFDRYVSIADRQHFLRLLGGVARIVPISHRVMACRDPKDDKFLHVALNGEAEVIVTGDADLLVLHPFHGVDIVSPAVFLLRP
ncbi:putative toxin-antitoxin system toxin component, PIN family [Cupriavidus sp. CV2]|uniref:putative toxin-antitoxin system toxin component, PIN family n=1 Tax=Cupriavidus ulmosensis TaxID=3065913 RepID=UPI00296AC8EF|nr:putative toxin-antitoxin system toxin component, PIN family [Cupriavidus sp. CV2]MDW3687711.1 putative toxin-antitoxin system toxin component, PIN family [Cupriavidus sp. CV2]